MAANNYLKALLAASIFNVCLREGKRQGQHRTCMGVTILFFQIGFIVCLVDLMD